MSGATGRVHHLMRLLMISKCPACLQCAANAMIKTAIKAPSLCIESTPSAGRVESATLYAGQEASSQQQPEQQALVVIQVVVSFSTAPRAQQGNSTRRVFTISNLRQLHQMDHPAMLDKLLERLLPSHFLLLWHPDTCTRHVITCTCNAMLLPQQFIDVMVKLNGVYAKCSTD